MMVCAQTGGGFLSLEDMDFVFICVGLYYYLCEGQSQFEFTVMRIFWPDLYETKIRFSF